MSLVCNMVGGGSGGGGLVSSEAVIAVYVDVGTTVTMTKGGITLTPVMWQSSADASQETAIFTIQSSLFDAINSWTIAATDGIESDSTTLIVDDNEYYEVWLKFWHGQLYSDGNQWTRITGGFETYKGVSSASYSQGTINYGSPLDGVITIVLGSNKSVAAVTANKVDVTGYSKLNATIVTSNFATNRIFIAISNTNSGVDWTSQSSMVARFTPSSNNFTGTMTLDISSYSGDYYVAIGGYGNYQCTVSDIYLSVN